MQLKASRTMACWMRLARKPGTSRATRIGTRPRLAMISASRSQVASSVCSPFTTSTPGTRCAGRKKCRFAMRAWVAQPSAMSVMRKPEALLAIGTPAGTSRSSSAKTARFISSRSGTASITTSASAKPTSSSEATRSSASTRRAAPPSCASDSVTRSSRAGQAGAVGLHRRHPPAAGQEDGGDVAAHQPEADDGGVARCAGARWSWRGVPRVVSAPKLQRIASV